MGNLRGDLRMIELELQGLESKPAISFVDFILLFTGVGTIYVFGRNILRGMRKGELRKKIRSINTELIKLENRREAALAR